MRWTQFSKPLNLSLRIVLAALFLFSGLAKAINPFGLSIQIAEYLGAMGLDLFTPWAPVLAVALPAAETLLGFMLAFGLLPRVTAWTTSAVMAGFTGLTFWIFLTNPVNDCGCFGDILKISNAATFYKNVIFFALAILYIYSVTRAPSPQAARWRGCKWATSLIISLGMPLWSTTTLPLFDGTEYGVGVNLVELGASQTPAPVDGAGDEITLVYKNRSTGTTREFAVTDTTWYDTLSWEYVETLTKSTVPAPASSAKFMMLDATGQDLSATLATPEPVLLLVSPQLIDITPERVQAIQKANPALRVIVLTAAPTEPLTASSLEAYGADYSTLRAMIQHAQGGAILLRNGVISQKWALPQLPEKIL